MELNEYAKIKQIIEIYDNGHERIFEIKEYLKNKMIKKEVIFETFVLKENVNEIDLLEVLIEKANILSAPFVDSTFRDMKKIIKIIRER